MWFATEVRLQGLFDRGPECRRQLKEEGAKAFGTGNELKEKKIAKLERMIGQKEVEIALLKNFLGES